MRTCLLCFVLATFLFFLIGPAAPSGWTATIIVPDDQPTIQIAIGVATTGDTIQVRNGTYVENIDFLGKAITVQPLTATLPPPQCIIDGGSNGTVVTFANGEGSSSVLRGFLIRNGTGTMLNYSLRGGGILCYGASPTIEDNWIVDNTADYGAGIACYDCADPTIDENVIIDNLADYGGGISAEESSDPTITNNVIGTEDYGNSANSGGGIYCCGAQGSSLHPRIGTTGNGNSIAYNTATSFGGGIWLNWCVNSGGTATVTANTIENNSADVGGGAYCTQSAITIEWNVVEENTAGTGGGLALWDCHPLTVKKNRVRYNDATENAGGGIHCADADVIIDTNRILENWALLRGGGIAYCGEMYNDGRIVNNQVAANIVGEDGNVYVVGGAGIFIDDEEPELVNNTVTLNQVIYSGDAGGVYIVSASSYVRNMIIWGNSAPSNNDYYDAGGNANLDYSDVGGHGGGNNIDLDPLFVTNDPYLHITSSSPCKDSANSYLAPAIDFEGDTRPYPYAGSYDMGWDEYKP